MPGKFIVELTRSQQMALIDLICAELSGCNCHVEEFVDRSQDPPVVTTPGQLLRLVSDAKWENGGPALRATGS